MAKTPRGSSQGLGVYLIKDQDDLSRYLAANHPAYIQEYLPLKRDIRVVVIGREPVITYWRVPAPGQWLTNVARGGRVDFQDVPSDAVNLAVEAARLANFDDVGVDVAMGEDGPVILEFNFKYGRKGARLIGMDLSKEIADRILSGRL